MKGKGREMIGRGEEENVRVKGYVREGEEWSVLDEPLAEFQGSTIEYDRNTNHACEKPTS